ncbi:MAG: hypothetical protein ABI542_00045 [Gemmatimonadota bacterium]
MPAPGSRLGIAASTSSLLRCTPAIVIIGLGALVAAACHRDVQLTAPSILRGGFVDDYGTRHQIDDSLWRHGTANRYRVTEWNATSRFLIARNDSANVADAGRYDRIDWVLLSGEDGWSWAFCLVTWNAPSEAAARAATGADTAHPRTGCSGYPFTRMRRSRPDPGGAP